MGRIVVSEFVSVDGVMEDPGGSEGTRNAGWTFRFDRGTDGDGFKLNEVLGRRSAAARADHLPGLCRGLADHR